MIFFLRSLKEKRLGGVISQFVNTFFVMKITVLSVGIFVLPLTGSQRVWSRPGAGSGLHGAGETRLGEEK